MPLQFQPDVRIGYFNAALATAFEAASVHGLVTQKTIIVFSVNDKSHNPGSLHPFDLAIDFDVLGNNADDLKRLYQWLRVHLPAGYDVIFEGNHVHVEFDQHRLDATGTSTKA